MYHDSCKRFFRNELVVGDTVVYTKLRYRNFAYGKIIKITKCKVRLYVKASGCKDYMVEVLQDHSQVLKLEGKHLK